MVDLNIESFLVASSLLGVLAQRLVRRLCPACAQPGAPTPEALQKSGASAFAPKDQVWMTGRGCPKCEGTGYIGRVGVHELLVVNEEIKELIANRATEQVVRNAQRRSGMVPMLEDGVRKAMAGITTLDELIRVVSPERAAVEASTAQTELALPMPELIFEPGRKLRILLVEDSSTIRTVVKYFLELDGFSVIVASHDNVGLEIATRDVPDLIISDIKMPGLDGIALVRTLRNEARTRHIPILMLTAEESVETETQGLASGADDYIVKPVEPRRLAARVRTALARKRAS